MPIPLIPEIPEELLKIFPTGRFVIFLGAGVSRLMNHPSWDLLADRCLGQLIGAPKITFSHADLNILRALHPRKKLSIAVDIWEESGQDLKDLLKHAIKSDGRSGSRVYELLADIDVPFVTTNYDDCFLEAPRIKPIFAGAEKKMDRAEKQDYPQRKPISAIASLTSKDLTDPANIIYLHGRLNDGSPLVLTTRDYIDHYRNSNVQEFLDQLFDQYNVLFIGYGLDEEEIIDFIIRRKRTANETKHFRLIPFYSHEETLFKHLSNYYLQQCQVRLIPYRLDENDHAQLEKVLAHWLPTIKSKIKPINFIEKTKLLLDPIIGCTDGT